MKKLLTTILALLVIAQSIGQNQVKSEAAISAVDVYPQGAKLYMKSQARLMKGQNRIEIFNIPLSVYQQTLSAGIAASGVTIHSSTFEQNNNPELTDPITLEAKSQVAKLSNESLVIKLKINTIDEQIATLKKQCNAKEGSNAPLDYVAGVVTLLGTQMNKLQTERHEFNLQVTAKSKAIEELNKQIAERYSVIRGLSNTIIVVADSEQEIVAPVFCEFVVSSAFWMPYYEVRIKGNLCEVVTKAKVSQSTNLEWKNVKLNLVTSNLQANSAELPVVRTEYVPLVISQNISFDAKNIGRGKLAPAMSSMELVEVTLAEDYSHELMQQSSQTMAVEQRSLNLNNYQTTVPYTIASQSSVDLKLVSVNVPLAVEYLIMPTLSNSAFLVANLTTDGSYKDADANVYLNDTFIGSQNFSAAQLAADSIHLISKISLGVDNSITVKRTDKNYTKNNIQFFDRTSQIVNNKKETVAIKVVDSYPVSTTNDVKVENVVLSSGSSAGNYQGVVNWVSILAPSAKTEVNIKYNVRDTRRR